jgi:hypothetical protein
LAHLPKKIQNTLKDLPPKQQRFVMAYCGEARGNGSLAARIAGYPAASAGFQGYSLLTEPVIRQAVDSWMHEFAMGSAELTARIADTALANPGPFVVVDPTTNKAKLEITEANWARYQHWVRALEVDPKSQQITKLHLYDSQRAMSTLAKILKLFSDAPSRPSVPRRTAFELHRAILVEALRLRVCDS